VPVSYNALRLRHERGILQTFDGQQRVLAQNIGRLVLQRANQIIEGKHIVPNLRANREALKQGTWELVRTYYIGFGADPFDGSNPQSEYARLLVDGVKGAIRIQVQRQDALLKQTLKNAPDVYRWLTGHRSYIPIREINSYDPFYLFVDPRGYRLSDRIWQTAIDQRSRIDRLLDYHIGQGTAAVRIARLLEDFLTPGTELIKTRTPYGQEGSYAARRLARTEITAAAGRATVNANIANPFVSGTKWSLSASHRCCDICDDYARGGPNGDGVYLPGSEPPYPAHPHDLCNLSPVISGNTSELIEELRREIGLGDRRARQLQGAFNIEWLINALFTGLFIETVLEPIA